MKALLLSEYKKLEVTDMPVPDVGTEEVLIRVKACGICGSDVHGFDGSTGRRIPPLVMGHEASGIVDRVGSGVRGFKEGDRVAQQRLNGVGGCDRSLFGGAAARHQARQGRYEGQAQKPHAVSSLEMTLECHN